MPAAARASEEPGAAILALLLETLQKLADAGEADAACRIAGRACVVLRRTDFAAQRRFDALLHRLTRKLPPAQKGLDCV